MGPVSPAWTQPTMAGSQPRDSPGLPSMGQRGKHPNGKAKSMNGSSQGLSDLSHHKSLVPAARVGDRSVWQAGCHCKVCGDSPDALRGSGADVFCLNGSGERGSVYLPVSYKSGQNLKVKQQL